MKMAISGWASLTKRRAAVGVSKGEIANEVRTFVVFAHFIAGGREEGEEDFALRLFAAQAFDERTSLLKFAE